MPENDYESFENFTKALKSENLSNHIHWTNHILIKQMACDMILLKEKILGNGKKGLCDQQEYTDMKVDEALKKIEKLDKKPMTIVKNVGIIIASVSGGLGLFILIVNILSKFTK